MEILEGSKVFIDTNILVYFKLEYSLFHTDAKKQLNTLIDRGAELWISRQVIREYLSCITREENLKPYLNNETILKEYAELLENFSIADETDIVSNYLLSFFSKFIIVGKQIHDANIVATMLAYNIKHLVTKNSDDFKRFTEMIDVIPL